MFKQVVTFTVAALVLPIVAFAQLAPYGQFSLSPEQFESLSAKDAAEYVKNMRETLIRAEAHQGDLGMGKAEEKASISIRMFGAAMAEEGACSAGKALGARTSCIFAGNLMSLKGYEQKDGTCRFLCPAPESKGCAKGTVACNRLLFAQADGGVKCVAKTEFATRDCAQVSVEDSVYWLKKKLRTEDGKAAWEGLQKELTAHCKEAHFYERVPKGQGTCDVLERWVSDVKGKLKVDQEQAKALAEGERTVCTFDFRPQDRDPSLCKITFGKLSSGREAGNVYCYEPQHPYGEGGWKLHQSLSYSGCKDCGEKTATYSFDNRSMFKFSETQLYKSKFTFSTNSASPGVCSFDGIQSASPRTLVPRELKGKGATELAEGLSAFDRIGARKDLDAGATLVLRSIAVAKVEQSGCGDLDLISKFKKVAADKYEVEPVITREGKPYKTLSKLTFVSTGLAGGIERVLSDYRDDNQNRKATVETLKQNSGNKSLKVSIQDLCNVARAVTPGGSGGGVPGVK
jgi:hypothetical protein